MKKNKKTILHSLILYSLRFHHQDLHQEIEELKSEISEIKNLLKILVEKNNA